MDEDAQANCVRRLDACHGVPSDARLVVAWCVVTADHLVSGRVVVLDEEEVCALVAADELLITFEAQTLSAAIDHLRQCEAAYRACGRGLVRGRRVGLRLGLLVLLVDRGSCRIGGSPRFLLVCPSQSARMF